jgi:hypothetical protein
MAEASQGALVNRAVSGFAIGTTATAVEWNNEVYDIGYHDAAINPSRLTVLAGSTVSPASVSGSKSMQADSSMRSSAKRHFRQRPVLHGKRAGERSEGSVATDCRCRRDYFEVFSSTAVASNLLADSNCWFAMNAGVFKAVPAELIKWTNVARVFIFKSTWFLIVTVR